MKKIMLVGPPNVGKSVIFQALTGQKAVVSNYPGTTVEITKGVLHTGGKHFLVMDTPGIYSLEPFSEEEAVTCRMIAAGEADLVVQVIDAKNIARMLPLTIDLLKQGTAVILVLNMMDEATNLGVHIDVKALAQDLMVPVIAATAIRGQGIASLKKCIAAVSLTAFAKSKECMEKADILQNAVRHTPGKNSDAFLRWLGKAAREPFSGFILLALVLYVGLYQLVGNFGAGYLVDTFQDFFDLYLTPKVLTIANAYIVWDWFRTLLVGQYGLYTMGFCYAVSIVLPIVSLFFGVFALLEDCGYLPRLALLTDVLFKKIGLNGRAVIPFSLGFGCGTMAVMVTRILNSRRERILAAFLLALAIPCSAQLGILLGLLSRRPDLLQIWLIFICLVFLAGGVIGDWLLPGKPSPFYMELPPMRRPHLRAVALKTWQRVVCYFKEILPLFLLMSAVLTLLDFFGVIDWLIVALVPLMDCLGLPGEFAPILLLGFFRRDYGAAGLYGMWSSARLDDSALLVAATLLTLCMPCAAQVVVMIKEQGWKVTGLIAVLTFFAAFFSAWIMRGLLTWHIL